MTTSVRFRAPGPKLSIPTADSPVLPTSGSMSWPSRARTPVSVSPENETGYATCVWSSVSTSPGVGLISVTPAPAPMKDTDAGSVPSGSDSRKSSLTNWLPSAIEITTSAPSVNAP